MVNLPEQRKLERHPYLIDAGICQLVGAVVLLCNINELVKAKAVAVPLAELGVKRLHVSALAVNVNVAFDAIKFDVMSIDVRQQLVPKVLVLNRLFL